MIAFAGRAFWERQEEELAEARRLCDDANAAWQAAESEIGLQAKRAKRAENLADGLTTEVSKLSGEILEEGARADLAEGQAERQRSTIISLTDSLNEAVLGNSYWKKRTEEVKQRNDELAAAHQSTADALRTAVEEADPGRQASVDYWRQRAVAAERENEHLTVSLRQADKKVEAIEEVEANNHRLRQKNTELGRDNQKLRRAGEKLAEVRKIVEPLPLLPRYDDLHPELRDWPADEAPPRAFHANGGVYVSKEEREIELSPAVTRYLYLSQHCPTLLRLWHKTPATEFCLSELRKYGLIRIDPDTKLPEITKSGRRVLRRHIERYGADHE